MIGLTDQLFERAPDGIVIHDGDQVIAANPALLRMVGAQSTAQVVGRPVSDLFEHPHLKGVEHQLIAGEQQRVFGRFVRERLYGIDGTVHDVDAHAELFQTESRPQSLLVLLVLHDAREQVDAERREQERHEAARNAALVTEVRRLAGGVAHVLNNRLQIVMGFANLLAEEVLSSSQRHDVQQILRAAMDGADVTRQLLQAASGATHRAESVALDLLTPRLIQQMSAQGIRHERPIRVTTAPGTPVQVDPTHVRDMLTYLLANARRATRVRGDITVIVRPQVLRHARLASDGQTMAAGTYQTVAVKDSGDGIAEGDQRHMFNPFFSTVPVGEANGLGLSAVQGLLRQNGGYLTYDSAPAEGSTFTLWFPDAGAGTVEATASAAATPAVPSSILVIGRDPHARGATARCLERAGYRVLAVRTVAEAREVVAHVRCPSLIVLNDSLDPRTSAVMEAFRAQCQAAPLLLAAELGLPRSPAGGTDVWTPFPDAPTEYALVSRVRALLGDAG